jgi:hypothetical protein
MKKQKWQKDIAREKHLYALLNAMQAQRDTLLRMTLYSACEAALKKGDNEFQPPTPEEFLEYVMRKDAPWNAISPDTGQRREQ